MAGELLLTLKEIPSFEGELTVRLMEERDSEGRASYSLVCEKKPPLEAEEVPLIAGVRSGVFGEELGLKEISKSISWQQDTWWCEPPGVWKALGELSRRLLNRANAPSMTKSLQSNTRKQLIKQLQGRTPGYAGRKKQGIGQDTQ